MNRILLRRTLALCSLLFFCLTCLPITQARGFSPQSSNSFLTLPQVVPAEKDITVYGTKIHYAEAGSGPVVILLHGLGGNWTNWSLNIGPLVANYHVLALDQIGFGKSDKPLINYSVATYVDFLDQFCKQLKIEHASLVGVSLGGWIAASYAIAFPNKVDRLVLVDAAGYAPPANFDNRTLYGLNPSTRAGMKTLSQRIFYNQAIFGSDAVIDSILSQRINAGDGYTINSIIDSITRAEGFLDKRVQAIKQPTLIVWGRQDGLVLLGDGERFKREIPKSTLVVFEQCGHVPPVEKATEFNAALLQFLAAR